MPPDPLGFVVHLRVEDFDPRPVDQASAALRDYSLTIDAAADLAEGASQKFFAMGEALLAPLVASISQFKAFQFEMFGVQKITGDTDSATRGLADSLITLSQNSTLSADRLANVAQIAAQLGIRGTDALEAFVGTVSRMALVTDLTAEHAAKSFARINELFGLTANQVERLGSAINELENRTTATASELVSIVQRLGPLAATIGLNVKQALGFAATLKDVGITSEEAGTNLSTVFSRMGANISKFAHVAGVSGKIFREKFIEDPTEAMFLLLEGINKLAQKSTPKALEGIKSLSLGGARSSKVLLALANSVNGLRENIAVANDAFDDGTSLQSEFGIQTRSLSAQVDILVNRIRAIGLQIGSVLVPPLALVVRLFSVFVRIVGLIPAPMLAIGVVLVGLVGTFALLIGALLLAQAGMLQFSYNLTRMANTAGISRSQLEHLGATTGTLNASIFVLGEAVGAIPLPAFLIPVRSAIVATIAWGHSNIFGATAIGFQTAATYASVKASIGEAYWKGRLALLGWRIRLSVLAEAAARKINLFWQAIQSGAARREISDLLLSIKVRFILWRARNAETLAAIRGAAATQASALATNIAAYAAWGFNAAISANPIAAVIVLVASLAVAYGYLAKKILDGSKAAQVLGAAIAFAFLPIMPLLSLGLVALIAYRNNFLGFRTAIFTVARAFGFFFGTIVRVFKEGFGPLIDALSVASQAASDFWDSLGFSGGVLDDVFTVFKLFVSEAIQPLIADLKVLSESVKEFLTEIGILGPMSEDLRSLIKGFVTYTVSLLLGPVKLIAYLIINFISFFVFMASIVTKSLTGIAFLVKEILTGIVFVLTEIVDGISFLFSEAFSGISFIMKEIWSAIAAGAELVMRPIQFIINGFWRIIAAAKAVKERLIGSSLLHIGEAGILAASMIAGSLLPVLEEVGKPRVATISATAGAPVSSVRAASSVSGASAASVAARSGAGAAAGSTAGGGGKRQIEIVVPISLTLDGRTIAQVVQRVFCEEDVLGYGPLRFSPGGGG